MNDVMCSKCQLWTPPDKMTGNLCYGCVEPAKNAEDRWWEKPMFGRPYVPVLMSESHRGSLYDHVALTTFVRHFLGDAPPRISKLPPWQKRHEAIPATPMIKMYNFGALAAVSMSPFEFSNGEFVAERHNPFVVNVYFAAPDEEISTAYTDWKW